MSYAEHLASRKKPSAAIFKLKTEVRALHAHPKRSALTRKRQDTARTLSWTAKAGPESPGFPG